jgi:hypothetical protein
VELEEEKEVEERIQAVKGGGAGLKDGSDIMGERDNTTAAKEARSKKKAAKTETDKDAEGAKNLAEEINY